MEDQLIYLCLIGMLAMAANAIAWRNGFFAYPKGMPISTYPLAFLHPLLIMTFYFVLQGLLVPSFVYVGWAKILGAKVDFSSIAGFQQIWMNIAGVFIATPLLWLYARFLDPGLFKRIVIGPDNKQKQEFMSSNYIFGAKAWLMAFPLSLTLGMLMQIIVEHFFHPPEGDQIAVQLFKMTFGHKLEFWLTLIGIVILVPAAEEMIFRGFMQTWIKKKVGTMWSIILTSVLFASFHFSSLHGWHNLELLPTLFLLSCFLGFLFERQGSIWASIGLHSTFNFVSVCMIALPLFKGEYA